MHRLNIISLVIFITVITGCSNSNREVNRDKLQKEAFIYYLDNTFSIDTITEEELFIVFPCVGCAGCERFIYTEFTDHLINNDSFTLIICDPERKGFASNSPDVTNILYDKNGVMSVYDFGTGNPTCFVVKDNAVVSTYTLSPEVLRWMGMYLTAQRTKQF